MSHLVLTAEFLYKLAVVMVVWLIGVALVVGFIHAATRMPYPRRAVELDEPPFRGKASEVGPTVRRITQLYDWEQEP